MLVEQNKILIYDMSNYIWIKQIEVETDVAYWIDRGNKAVTIAHSRDLICWETKEWSPLFKMID